MLYLVRGIQGSGKSTLAKQICREVLAVHFEADMYFYDAQGNYHWDPALGYPAHMWCFHSARIAIAQGKSVVVSNTFIKRRELKKYLSLTEEAVVFRCTGEYKNIHDVPQEFVDLKKNRMSDYDGEVRVNGIDDFKKWLNERR